MVHECDGSQCYSCAERGVLLLSNRCFRSSQLTQTKRESKTDFLFWKLCQGLNVCVCHFSVGSCSLRPSLFICLSLKLRVKLISKTDTRISWEVKLLTLCKKELARC